MRATTRRARRDATAIEIMSQELGGHDGAPRRGATCEYYGLNWINTVPRKTFQDGNLLGTHFRTWAKVFIWRN